MSQLFKSLLEELEGEHEAMAKALPADDGKDDDKIQAAAGEGGGEGGEGKGEGEGAGEGDEGKGEKEGELPFGKSMQMTDAEGNVIEAFDGTELVKSLMDDVAAMKTQFGETEGQMAKALESTLGLVKSQGALIKSLQEQVLKLGGEGRGRKTVVTVTEKVVGTMQKSQADEGISPAEFMVKSQAAFDAGRITGKDFTVIDVSLRSGVPVDPALVSKVIA
ncbi:hypothetical protein AWB80_08384 [Caballeronia pedi]|uniref:Uncharacterized protein n=1 Tax=Caballeronia pedi TaxID=1777141 RepID=A0A158E6Y8_9BURK|nr:hypothetical protein [Caballeronia pedi]SAL02533.1 hypothetical protein AWB80_08384 [Caballeronia pedi]